MEDKQIERNPLTHEKHRREVFWQITIPLVIGLVMILGLAALVIVTAVQGGNVSQAADASLVYLIIPVMVMSQHDPVKADKDIAAGKFDISAIGRPLLCDPEYPNKVIDGRPDRIVKCIRCNTCMIRGLAGMPIACPLNPKLGREYLLDEYKMGPWKKEENIIPKSWETARMRPLYKKPWWKDEIDYPENNWRPFRGPGPR